MKHPSHLWRLLLAAALLLGWTAPGTAQAYNISYSYLLASAYDEDDPEYQDATPPSLHHERPQRGPAQRLSAEQRRRMMLPIR